MSGPIFKLAEQLPENASYWGGPPPLGVQQLWFTLQRSEWSTLVVVPAGPESSGMDFGRPLYEVGRLALGERLRLLDAREVKVSGAAGMVIDMLGANPSRPASPEWSERVLVVIESIVSQPTGIPLALAADAAVLGVELGRSSLESARRTLDTLGRARFLGCLTLPPR
ncbi:MAG TPA: hypothetical protein VMT11_09100 [Myxococcaceae bacterium]|nr:hypothetical protein [Myxococcaceae bacterium]